MNVLVYAGKGVSAESLHHTVRSLRNALGTFYDIKLVNGAVLGRDPWEDTCSLLVVPGGRDLAFVSELAGRALGRIRNYVLKRDGRYLGICAGAYFACRHVQFELGTPLEVRGERELALCPATASGTLYPGFQYDSEGGAHAVPISVGEDQHQREYTTKVYYNGGCTFDMDEDNNSSSSNSGSLQYKTVATYAEHGKPAIVAGYAASSQCARVVLSGVHIEYDAEEIANRQPDLSILGALRESPQDRLVLWNELLQRLGLVVAKHRDQAVLAPTPLFMFFPEARRRLDFLTAVRSLDEYNREDNALQCECNNIQLIEERTAIPAHVAPGAAYPLVVTSNERTWSDPSWTFSPDRYYAHLAERAPVRGFEHIGRHLLYAEYIPSTQTIQTQNPTLASVLPDGAFILAGDQLAGKGRGANTWLSSKGCLQFTMLLHHRTAATLSLIQHLVGLAMAEAICAEPGYEAVEVRLKWPNDLYTCVDGELRKLGGILVNSQTFDEAGFLLLIGFGTNVYDTPWTRSLNDLVALHNARTGACLSPWTKERLLARFMAKFAELYRQTTTLGFPFQLYHQRWMHTGQVVFLESEQIKVRIEGIDEAGFLIVRPYAEDGGKDGNGEGRIEGKWGEDQRGGDFSGSASATSQPFLLQPDGNSFDMMQNLIRRKL